MNTLSNSLTSNLTLKVFSLIIGYASWFALSQSQPATLSIRVPISIEQAPATSTLDLPDTILLTLAGKRSALSTLDLDNLCLHISADTLRPGKNNVIVTTTNLLLPESITVVDYYPTPLSITVTVSSPLTQGSENTSHAVPITAT